MNPSKKIALCSSMDAHRDHDRCQAQTFVIKGYSVTMRLEPEMWDALEEIGQFENRPVDALIELVHKGKPSEANLASAVRVFILNYYTMSSVSALRSPTPGYLN